MPFKWRLKKTRKYDISTKNLFIVGVYLLDNAYLECTLSADSTGQECLNSIAQRIELSESSYFGLRYVTKKLHFHWVDLEKPLKKQLDKYAQPTSNAHSHCLYFGVMYYVIGAHKIPDEVARYHYYLQLKNDVMDGKLPCSVEQAIRLASYSLQAEFGDYEPDKYAAEDYILFPKTLMKEEMRVQLLSEAIAGHASLQGVPPLRAELQYVKEVQMMDGYGTEYYNAKDESRKDLYLGTSHAGIFARYLDGGSTVYYKWGEIAKVTQNKKTLEVDTPKSSVLFQMEDSDTAKYVSRLAQLQRQFYKSSKGNLSQSLTDISLAGDADGGHLTVDAQQVYIPPTDSSHSSQELVPQQTGQVHQHDQRYHQEFLQSSQQSLESSTESQQFPIYSQTTHHQFPHTTEGDAAHQGYQQHAGRHESVTPTPDGEPLYVNRAALLPAYRPSPDYDTVMQQRMLQQQQQQQQQHQHNHFSEVTPHLGAAQVYVHPDGVAYSQPEISQINSAFNRDDHGNYANVDALRSYGHSVYANIFHDDQNFFPGRGVERGNNLAVHPTYSSPELNTEMHQTDAFNAEFSAQEAMMYQVRPPPPYPRASSSTPDLAGQASGIPVDHSDFLRQNLTGSIEQVGPHSILTQSALDRSVDDLSQFQNYNPQLGLQQMTTGAPLNTHSDLTSTNLMLNQKNLEEGEAARNVLSDSVDGVKRSSVDHSATQDAQFPGAIQSLQTENSAKVLSDDQDDTSSEHSYSTFHAKDSEESSDEEGSKQKSVQLKDQSKIQIRMFTPQEAPPPSKLKEQATLRESFRRMKIARVASLGSKDHSGLRSSLRGLKEATEIEPTPGSLLNALSEQVQENDGSRSSVQNIDPSSAPASSRGPEIPLNLPPGTVETPEMKEILERLGAPPPYPGTGMSQPAPSPRPTISQNPNTPVMNNTNTRVEEQNLHNLPSTTQKNLQQNPAAVKRSSSDRSGSLSTPPALPERQDLQSKPRAATYNLDMVVPISRPGMVLSKQDSSVGTSVLRSANNSTVGENDTDSVRGSSDHGDRSAGLSVVAQDAAGSDTDSDQDQGPLDGHLHAGPLKMASLNGLTLSRSMLLFPMNDDSRAPKDERRRMLESKISEGQVYAEFEQIPKKSQKECSVAKAAHNATRNRFKDVLPYDETRVKLAPRRDNPDGYINASHIKLTANDAKWLFIATQAPLANTAVDFWQMVWENNVNVLAMLTPFEELGKSKCYIYWPQEPGPSHKHNYSEFEVELQFTGGSLCYLTSRIILRFKGQERLVWHLQYTAWPDHGCPEDTHGFLEFLDEVESISRLAESESNSNGDKSPVVVHCSAGVGRTGVVILTMVMKWCLEHNHNVDLPKALLGIRNQRMHMVQTMGQYRFIHDTLIQYLKNSRLI